MPMPPDRRNEPLSTKVSLALAELGPIGRLPAAPGTWGSLLAALAAPWLFIPLSAWSRAFFLLALFLLGSWVAARSEAFYQRKDPGSVIIDEFLGQWIVCIPLQASSWPWLGLGFVLFRLFDILKPWPVKASEDWLPGGFGVMLDDVVAGIYGGLCLWIIGLVLGFF